MELLLRFDTTTGVRTGTVAYDPSASDPLPRQYSIIDFFNRTSCSRFRKDDIIVMYANSKHITHRDIVPVISTYRYSDVMFQLQLVIILEVIGMRDRQVQKKYNVCFSYSTFLTFGFYK